MRILLWHVHGSWTTAFVQGPHTYVLPVDAERGPDGRGRAQTWDWPASVVERTPERLREEPIDCVVLQRPHERELAAAWTGRTPGRDLPAIYLEHNTPGGDVPYSAHPMRDEDIALVHVTHFNRLLWDTGRTPTRVIEHGICDPGHLYTGEWPRAAVVMNDPVRRGRAVGADLVPALSGAVPMDVFGMRVDAMRDPDHDIWAFDDLPQHTMHAEIARRRVYLHTARWTSLGLSLIEAMQLGMPVVALGTTEVPRAVPADVGVVSGDPEELARALKAFVSDPVLAHEVGARARTHALSRFGLGRFLADWDDALGHATAR